MTSKKYWTIYFTTIAVMVSVLGILLYITIE